MDTMTVITVMITRKTMVDGLCLALMKAGMAGNDGLSQYFFNYYVMS